MKHLSQGHPLIDSRNFFAHMSWGNNKLVHHSNSSSNKQLQENREDVVGSTPAVEQSVEVELCLLFHVEIGGERWRILGNKVQRKWFKCSCWAVVLNNAKFTRSRLCFSSKVSLTTQTAIPDSRRTGESSINTRGTPFVYCVPIHSCRTGIYKKRTLRVPNNNSKYQREREPLTVLSSNRNA
jgi:hypothetical protein